MITIETLLSIIQIELYDVHGIKQAILSPTSNNAN